MSNDYIPNSASIPNILFDYWMSQLTPGEFKVLMAIARKTYGWHKTRDSISLRQIEDLTGLARKSISQMIEALVARDLIIKIKSKTEWGDDAPNLYEINIECKDRGGIKDGGGSNLNTLGVGTSGNPRVGTSGNPQNPLLTKPTIQKREGDKPPPRPRDSSKKEKPIPKVTIPFGKYVVLKEGEYETLCEELTKPLVDYYVAAINNFIPNRRQGPYKDYAAAIRSWHNDDNAKGTIPKISPIKEKQDELEIISQNKFWFTQHTLEMKPANRHEIKRELPDYVQFRNLGDEKDNSSAKFYFKDLRFKDLVREEMNKRQYTRK